MHFMWYIQDNGPDLCRSKKNREKNNNKLIVENTQNNNGIASMDFLDNKLFCGLWMFVFEAKQNFKKTQQQQPL